MKPPKLNFIFKNRFQRTSYTPIWMQLFVSYSFIFYHSIDIDLKTLHTARQFLFFRFSFWDKSQDKILARKGWKLKNVKDGYAASRDQYKSNEKNQ